MKSFPCRFGPIGAKRQGVSTDLLRRISRHTLIELLRRDGIDINAPAQCASTQQHRRQCPLQIGQQPVRQRLRLFQSFARRIRYRINRMLRFVGS
jgi:hypothetical protein